MANSITGDGSYSPNIVAGIGDTGTVSIDTGPIDANYLTAGSAMAGDGNGTITITGDNGFATVADPGIYAYSRLLVGSGYGPYSGTGVLNVNNGGSLTSTNNAALASGSIPLGGYSNLVVGSGPNSDGTVNVDGVGTFGSSILALYGGSAGFVLGADSGTGAINVTNGAQFFTLTGVVGAGDTSGGSYPGGTGTVTVDGVGSEFFATTNNGNFLVDSDQAPVIFVGQNDGNGNLSADNYGSITIQNVIGDGKSSPTLVIGDDLNSVGGGDINNNAILNIIQYGAANSGNRLNGNSGLIVGNAGVGQFGADGGSQINVLGDRANLVVSVGSYDGQGAPIAPLGGSQLTLYYAAVATIDSQGYSGPNGSQATIGAQRLSDGRILVSQEASLNVISATDVVGDYTTGRIVVGDLGNGTLSVGRRGYVNASELIVGGRGYTASALDNSTDLTFGGYNAAPDGGGAGLFELTAGNAQIIITATDNTPDRGITLGQASGTTGTLNIVNPNTGISTGSYVKSTGGFGSIVIGEYGTGTATITGGGALYGGFITVGLGATAAVDTLSITGVGSKAVASGLYTNVLAGGVSNGQSALVEIGRQDGSYGRLVINSGGELEISNDAGNDQNPTLIFATENDSYGRAQIDGAGSAINIIQNGARFLAPSGDIFGGAEAIIGNIGYANVDVSNDAQINVLGDSAMLSVGDGGYDGGGAPIISSVQSNLSITSGADVVVDSQAYGFDQAAGDYSLGSSVFVGRGVGGYGRIDVDGAGTSLTVATDTDFAGDYISASLVVGDLGRGELNVSSGATVDARSLKIGNNSYYDDGMGGGRQYGGYLPSVTAAGDGLLTISSGGQVTVTSGVNTPYDGIRIAEASGTNAAVVVNGSGSILTSTAGSGRVSVGRYGTGDLVVEDGGQVQGFFFDIGRAQGSDGDVYVDGYGSSILVSNAYGAFSDDPAFVGEAGLLRLGREDGSNGYLAITTGGRVDVINDPGTGYDNPFVQIGRNNGAYGRLVVSGEYVGSGTYASTLRIAQTGPVGDYVATGGIGPYGPRLAVGQGGQGVVQVTNGADLLLEGAAARLSVASGRRDAAGNPDTTTDVSSLEILGGSRVLVDSLSYGGTQDFTDPMGGTITGILGARVDVGSDIGATGIISVDGAGSTLSVISADQSAGDYDTGQIRVGLNGGTGTLNVNTSGAVYGRGLNLGFGAGSLGSSSIDNGSTVQITGTNATRYQGVAIGRDGGMGSITLSNASNLSSTGGTGRLQVGRDGGTGQLTIQSGSTVDAFFAEVGRGTGSDGSILLDGYDSRLTLSDAYGSFDPAVVTGPRGGTLTVGRADGGDGDIAVINGASLNVINDSMAAPGVQGNGAALTIGRDLGATGLIIVTGDDGMGNGSYLRVQNYGRSNDGPTAGEYYGPVLRLGVDGAQGQLSVEDGAGAFIVGEDALIIIGEGDGGGATAPQSTLAVRTGAQLVVTSEPNPDFILPYNAAADIIVGDKLGSNGLLEVSGAGSSVEIRSDNAANTYAISGDLTFGAGLEVGREGYGNVIISGGGEIIISGADDLFPHLTIADGSINNDATGFVTVGGVGSRLEIQGTSAGYGSYIYGAGGLIDVGVSDGSIGNLTIGIGGEVSNSAVNSLTRVAKEIGSRGDIEVTGTGSTFNAGTYLAIGADLDLATGAFIDNQSGDGRLMVLDGGAVTTTSAFVGTSGVLSISDASFTGDLEITGAFFVGGVDSQGDATVTGSIEQTSGLLEFEVFGVNAGEFDTLTSDSLAILSGDVIAVDVGAAAALNIGDSAVLFSTTGSLFIDTTETVAFVGQAAGAGREFVLTEEFDPLGQSGPESQLVFSVVQATLAEVAGDLEIISEATGLVALTNADLSIVEGGVDPTLQTLTVTAVTGGQLESALDPGVAITSFSQQDVDDRLIRFVGDGSRGGFFDLSFTDSAGFVDSVTVTVAEPGVPDINVVEFPLGDALAIDGVTPGAYFGYSVSGAGDVNGDGIDDLIVGATTEDGDDFGSGAAFVIFGSIGPFSTDFDLNTLNGVNGFEIRGQNAEDLTGASVSAVGDVNGDGIDDLAIGSPGANAANGDNGAGKLHILFGSNAPVDPTISLANLPATEGVTIDGGAIGAGLGFTVFGGEDFNGDGVADIVAGGYGASLSGDVFVIFGDSAGLTGPADTNGLDGANGFRATGLGPSEFLGSSVSMADLDGDGLSDLVIGASGALSGNGSVFVVKDAAINGATVDVTTLSGADGFRIDGLGTGDQLGTSVSGAGDFNGDGVEDIVIAASGATAGGQGDAGSVYIIFGVANGFTNATFDLATLDGTNGFQIDGRDFGDNFGQSVSSVGDMNGDGFGDILIGAPNADPQGMISGEAYLIFGSDEGFAAQQNVTALTADQLSLITNFDVLDSAGASTGGGFDLNGDGLSDAVIGGPNAGPMDEGGALVVFGALTPFDPVIEGDLLVEAAQGQSGVITTTDLAASEPDAIAADLLYHVTNPVGGFVAASNAPGVPISTFTQANVDAGQVVFSKDATGEIGSFVVTVTDFDGDVSAPVTVNVQTPNLAGSFKLADLDGTNGFRLNGIDAGDLSGLAVSDAGDINGDGFDDVLIGAPYADTPNTDAGETFVVFGAAGGFAADIELSDLVNPDGFRVDGIVATDLGGRKLATAGDLNNDGIDDFLIGVSGADTNGAFNTGEVFVIYGDTTPFPDSFSLTGFDGTDGTRILGVDINSLTSEGLSEVGDFNGDGIDDIFIGAPFADSSNGSDAGEGYLVFGVDGGLGAEFDLATLNGANGFRLDGEVANGLTGVTTGIGDINNDGFDDIALSGGQADPLGRANAGSTHVIFGSDAPFNPVEQVNNLTGANGFRVNGATAGDLSGDSVSTAGDFNDDGIDDFIIGALGAGDAGAAYVIFGSETGFPATIDLGSLDGTNGFAINGADAGDRFGVSVSDAGDFDGDGVDDLLISADQADPGAATTGGEAYIIFGRSGPFGPSFDISTLNPANGFRIDSILAGDQLGRSVSAAGDVNNDGRDDIVLGAFAADPGGNATAGQSYVVFGFGPNQPPIARDDDFSVIADTPISGDLFADNGDDIDEDVDGDPFVLISVNGNQMQVGAPITLASGASVQVQSNGLFDYDPSGAFEILADGEIGADTFTYTIGNLSGETSTATVNLTISGVNDAPVAADDTISFTEDDAAATGDLFADNGLGADFDVDNGDAFTVVSVDGLRANVGQPVTLSGGGEIFVNDDGSFSFNSNNAYEGLAQGDATTETFTYTIVDSLAITSTATVNLDISGVNDAPVAQDDEGSIAEGGTASFNIRDDNGNGPDGDIDNDALRVTSANGQTINAGGALNFFTAQGLAVTIDRLGAVTLNASSPALDALREGEQLTDSFVYLLEDEFGLTDTAQVNVTVTGVNDAPIAANDLLRTDERTALTASLFADNGAGTDSDVDSDFTITAINGDNTLVGSQITLPSGALLSIEADGSVSFDPNGAFLALGAGEQATEQLTYTITDAEGATTNATVILAVDGVADTIFGTPEGDLIRGTDEANDIDGLGGNDLITGLDGDDTIKGGQGLDIIRGGADDDSLVGGPGKDRLFGEAGDDHLEGGGGNDRLLGLAGNDTILGNAGDDILSGGRGNDLVVGQDGDDRIRGGRDADTLIAGDGKDSLQGGTGNDNLFGQAGNDNLTGAGGADTLSGGDGIDRLFGRRGSDELTGGQGADRFIFNLGDGSDTITDFEQGADRIRIASGADTFADLTITQVGDDALIAFGNVRILALDEDAGDFTTSDFIL